MIEEIKLISQDRKDQTIRRLKSIEGQMRGLQGMIEKERPCVEVLTQIAAAEEGLKQVGKIMMRNYLENCVTNSIRSQDGQEADRIYDELMDIIYKFAR